MRRARSSRIAVAAIAFLAFLGTSHGQIQPPPTPTPGWDTRANHLGNPNYFQPAYPIVFVKAPPAFEPPPGATVCRDVIPSIYPQAGSVVSCGAPPPAGCNDYTDGQGRLHDLETVVPRDAQEFNYHLGTDVMSATNPGVGNELWIYIPPYGQVKKLFPRPIHDTNNIIDFTPSVGSVVEPSLSEDGTKVYFSYFQDATEGAGTLTKQMEQIPRSGADIYSIDLAPLLANPLLNLDSLTVTRLTTRTYTPGTHTQAPSSRDAEAMNPTLAATTTNDFTNFGTVYLHPTEVRTRRGLYLAYASNKRRLANSNNPMLPSNYNLNLHFARLNPDGTLGPEDNEFQYYTTTSAMSPTPLREGLAFSYQSTTDDPRYWHIQKLDSEGRWNSLIGYGSGDQLFHLGSFCVADEGGNKKDYFVALKYYNINNESFGSLWRQDLAQVGRNMYDNPTGSGVLVPSQDGATELTTAPGASLSQDTPSPYDAATGKHYGKFTTPRCGGVNQLYFAYTPTSANHRLLDYDCSRDIYRSHIGYRPNLLPWTPGKDVPIGHHTVIKRTNDDFNLLWPVPVVPWSVRSDGNATQLFTQTAATQPTPHIVPGEPFALIGTSALWNTDRRPPECYIDQTQPGGPFYFHPFGSSGIDALGNQNDQLTNNQDIWTQVYVGGFCSLPPQDSILGIAINVTSNKANMNDLIGYETGGFNSAKEATRLLGVYDVRPPRPPQNDQSFLATIPANVPIEFHALDSMYGMKLADVRSWHSLKPRETRTDCGGCHQHESGATGDFIWRHVRGPEPAARYGA